MGCILFYHFKCPCSTHTHTHTYTHIHTHTHMTNQGEESDNQDARTTTKKKRGRKRRRGLTRAVSALERGCRLTFNDRKDSGTGDGKQSCYLSCLFCTRKKPVFFENLDSVRYDNFLRHTKEKHSKMLRKLKEYIKGKHVTEENILK